MEVGMVVRETAATAGGKRFYILPSLQGGGDTLLGSII
jgi:hypothetical protein